MSFQKLVDDWRELSKDDPLWLILTDDSKKGNKWELDEFFATGAEEIDMIMGRIADMKFQLSRGRALDFGCGVGRLTQGLAKYFDHVDGVDISSSMIELSNKYNTHGDKCQFHLNQVNDLRIYPNDHFDLILTLITLQHMHPRYSANYIREFIRTLKPKGVLIFQLPSRPNDKNPLKQAL